MPEGVMNSEDQERMGEMQANREQPSMDPLGDFMEENWDDICRNMNNSTEQTMNLIHQKMS